MVSKKLFLYASLTMGLTMGLGAGTAFGQSRWIRERSENFEIYSDTNEASTRDALRSLEQVRSFLIQSTGAAIGWQGPTYVVGFKSDAEYAPYRPNEAAGAFYLTGADRDIVIVSGLRPEGIQAASGAYGQLAIRQLGLSLPAWLDQGLGDLCSTLRQTGTVAAVMGELTIEQRRALAADSKLPLETILNGATTSVKSRVQAESLVHMLLLSPEYGPKFKELVGALQTGAASQSAMETVYAKPLSGIEKDLQAYVSSGHLSAVPLPVKAGSSVIQASEPAPSLDLNLVLAAVYNRPGQDKEAQDRLEPLSHAAATRPEPWAGLGYVALRTGHIDLASQDFERAIALGANNPELMWDRVRLGWRDSAGDSEEGLSQILQRDPNRVDAKIKLAAILLDRRRPRQAYGLLQPVKDVPADVAPRFLTELAYAELETGERAEAQVTLARLAKSASSRDTAELNRLQAYAAGTRVMAVGPPPPPPLPEKVAEKTPAKAPVVARVTLGSTAPAASSGAASDDRQKAAEALEKASAAAREKAAAETKALEEADSLARQAAEAREKALAAARERVAAEAQEKAAAKARDKTDADMNAKEAAEAREKAATEAREKAAADAREKAEAKLRAKAEAEAAVKAAAEAKERAIAEAREKAAAEAREKAEALARAKAEAEAQAKAAAEAHDKAVADARAKAAATAAATPPPPPPPAAPTLMASNLVPPNVAAKIAPADNAPTASMPALPATPKIEDSIENGVFVEMVCMDTQIKIVLQTPQGNKKTFLIADPSNVLVSGRAGGKVELECGPQKPVNVRILSVSPGGVNFDGLVKGIYFD